MSSLLLSHLFHIILQLCLSLSGSPVLLRVLFVLQAHLYLFHILLLLCLSLSRRLTCPVARVICLTSSPLPVSYTYTCSVFPPHGSSPSNCILFSYSGPLFRTTFHSLPTHFSISRGSSFSSLLTIAHPHFSPSLIFAFPYVFFFPYASSPPPFPVPSFPSHLFQALHHTPKPGQRTRVLHINHKHTTRDNDKGRLRQGEGDQ